MKELASLLELLGEDITLKLLDAHAGTRVAVPEKLPRKHDLRKLLGDDGFAKLHEFFGGYQIAVPTARRWRIKAHEKRGLKPIEIARIVHCSEALVYAYQAKAKIEKQLRFNFDDKARS